MFLHLSVILFTGGVSVQGRVSFQSGGLCPRVGVSVQVGDLCPEGSLSRRSLSRGGGLCPGGPCLGGSLSIGVSAHWDLCPGGLWHRNRPRYGGRAGSANPTGMHSCLQLVLKMFVALDNEEIVYLVFK